MEIAAWNFVNGEAIQNVRPWIVRNEGNIWFAKHKEDPVVYAYITGIEDWARGDRKSFLIRSVKAGKDTRISVLGQTGLTVEYMPDTDGKSYFEQTEDYSYYGSDGFHPSLAGSESAARIIIQYLGI